MVHKVMRPQEAQLGSWERGDKVGVPEVGVAQLHGQRKARVLGEN